MTMPSEELRSLKRAHKFLRDIIFMSRKNFLQLAMSKTRRKMFIADAASALRHYPFDFRLDCLYKKDVCHDCGSDTQFCKCKQKV